MAEPEASDRGAGTLRRSEAGPERPAAAGGKSGKVVALGGGHGLAVALRAIRQYADATTAVVSVADDGGSSGRLRRDLDVPAPGDVRKCLVALAAPGNRWADAFEHRFVSGDLDGHALGNLVLVGLAETLSDFAAAIDEAGRLLEVVGRVLPATTDPVVLKAQVDSESAGGRSVEGQVAVMNVSGRIRHVELVPADAPAHPDAVAAIADADQVVLAPGSLFTSLLPVLAVPALRDAVASTQAQVVQVCNLRSQLPETEGLDAADHLRAVLEHGARVDAFLYGPTALACDEGEIQELGARPVAAEVTVPRGVAHDPARLATALRDLLEANVRGAGTLRRSEPGPKRPGAEGAESGELESR
ncbi:MAG: gluconeogenesis factor YvcK family protein [Acidimicrobiia bacterium]